MFLSLELLQISVNGDDIVVVRLKLSSKKNEERKIDGYLEIVSEIGCSSLRLDEYESECIGTSRVQQIHQVRSLLVFFHPYYLQWEGIDSILPSIEDMERTFCIMFSEVDPTLPTARNT